ncbi:GNAT family N-acetyltransferase [Chloroflexota bacterium]
MTDSAYIIRNYQPSDFTQYNRLYRETEQIEPAEQYPSSQSLREQLCYPNYPPEENLFVVETATDIVGYMDVTSEMQIGRTILNCLIYPEYRRQGLASTLLVSALRRVKELGTEVAQVCIRENNSAAQNALLRLGFSPVRHFLQMRVDITELDERETSRAALRCRYLQSGEEELLTEIQNISFTGSWGYHPNTVEEITYRLGLSQCSPHDVVLANNDSRISGYCWTSLTTESEGQIYMIGVDPDFQGQGIGRRLLLAGLSHLRSKGCPVAELTVDSQNKAACGLYQSIGFTVRDNIMWYEKAVG